MAAYSFAAQSLIAPFGGLDIVWNSLLAPYVLQEKLTTRRIVGCALICTGTGMAGGFGSHTDNDYTIDYVKNKLFHFRVGFYFVAFIAWFLLNQCLLLRRPAGSVIRGASLGMIAGTIAGNMWCLKASVEIIQFSINNGNYDAWKDWLPYALLLGAIFFAVSNVFYMTKGLEEYEALFMVTVYEGSMIVSGCVSGCVILLDLDGLEAWRIALYIVSVTIVVSGLLAICGGESDKDNDPKSVDDAINATAKRTAWEIDVTACETPTTPQHVTTLPPISPTLRIDSRPVTPHSTVSRDDSSSRPITPCSSGVRPTCSMMRTSFDYTGHSVLTASPRSPLVHVPRMATPGSRRLHAKFSERRSSLGRSTSSSLGCSGSDDGAGDNVICTVEA